MCLTYYRRVRTRAKGRWFGKPLREIAEEFGSARLIGDPEHVVSNKDFVEYEIHVHEPPIRPLNIPASVIHDGPEFVVLNKPSGIPVHPTVNYFHHSITELLKPVYGTLLPCYRLDRLTSGVLVLAKTPAFVNIFKELPKSKRYLARVHKESLHPSLSQNNEELIVTDPIVTFNAKRGFKWFMHAHTNAKPAETHIKLHSLGADQDSADPDVSDPGGSDRGLATLEVVPITGKTHQIRKHLALHDMPIHNDDVYFDAGRFKRLCQQPSQAAFDELWQAAEANREAKLIGKQCVECGIELYNEQIGQLDLHCEMYRFGEYEFHADPPFNA